MKKDEVVKITRYTPEQQPVWDTFAAKAKNAHFMHQRGYMDYHADRFFDHSLLIHDDEGTLRALLPANEKDGTLFSHQGLTFGGFITDADLRMHQMILIVDAVCTYARANGLRDWVYKAMPAFYHQQPASEDIYALFHKGAALTRIDASTTIDYHARIPFSSLRKRGAKKAQKSGVVIERSEDYAAFHQIIRQIVEGKYEAHVTHSEAEMRLLAQRFPSNIVLHAALLDGTMVAGILVFETATVAHSQYIGANDTGRELGALDLLFTTLIDDIYSNKRYFDFGISTEQAGKHLNEKLIAQKEGFGGRATVHPFFKLEF